jgi:hypothetical protein
MLAYDNCALFIGVEDYRLFDASLGQPAGSSDLPGARADALAFLRICAELGIPAENMRILTSPRLEPAAAGGVPAECLGDATQASILKGLEWLAERLGSSARPPGLLTYSGHGDWLEGQGLVICPSDTSGPNLKGAIPFKQIQSIFEAQRAMASLTVVLDTCHSGAARAGAGRAAGSLTGRSLPVGLEGGIPPLGDRVIAACKPSQLAWRGRFSGVGRGALSWAVGSTLEQWSPRPEGRHVELDLSYGELLTRVQSLLSALSFEQTPELRGRPGTAKTPFFHAGPGGAKEPTNADPTAVGTSMEVMPDVKVILSLSWSSSSWPLVSVGSNIPTGAAYNYQTEYWALDASFLSQLSSIPSGGSITFTPATYGAAGQPAVLTNPTTSIWTQLSTSPSGSWFVHSNTSTNTYYAVSFSLQQGTSPSAAWSGSVQWLAAAATGGSGPPSSIVGGSTMAFSYQNLPALPRGYSWFSMQLPALIWPTAPTVLGDASSGVAMTVMGSSLYLANTTSGGTIHVRSSTSGSSWGAANGAGVGGVQVAPAIAALGSTLYMVYNTADRNQDLAYLTSSDGVRWSSPINTSATSSGAPALATFTSGSSSVLCLAYQLGGDTTRMHTRVWTGSGWSSSATDPGATSVAGAPALAGFASALFLAFPDTSGRIQVYRTTGVSTTGISWPSSGNPIATLTPPAGSSWSAPGLGVWNGQLVLTFRDSNGAVWAAFSSNGFDWSGYQNLSSQILAIGTSGAPAAAALGSTLVLAWNGTTSTANGLSTLATSSTAVS